MRRWRIRQNTQPEAEPSRCRKALRRTDTGCWCSSEQEQDGVLPDYAGSPQEVTLTKEVTKVEGISLNKTSLSFSTKWDKKRLTASLTPANADNQQVTWTTSNAKVARVAADGEVMAVNDGTATITATSVDGKKKATCKVTVKGSMPDYSVLSRVTPWGSQTLKVSWEKGYNVNGYCIYRATSQKRRLQICRTYRKRIHDILYGHPSDVGYDILL